jgi:hypothetical protein
MWGTQCREDEEKRREGRFAEAHGFASTDA